MDAGKRLSFENTLLNVLMVYEGYSAGDNGGGQVHSQLLQYRQRPASSANPLHNRCDPMSGAAGERADRGVQGVTMLSLCR